MATQHNLPDGKIELRSVLIEKTDTDMAYKDKVPVTLNFDSNRVLGHAVISRTPEGLHANITLIELFHLSALTPSICYKVVEEEVSANGERIVRAGELLCLALCNGLNVDERIRPLGEQITELHL